MKNYSKQENIIRSLAEVVAKAARSERMTKIFQRWKDVNELRKPDRAPVWCRPTGCGWKELIPDESLKCTDPFLRDIEYKFRQIVLKLEIGDDHPIQSYFTVPAVVEVRPLNTWGLESRHIQSSQQNGAWVNDPPLKNEDDFEKLQLPTYSFNREASMQLLERHADIFGDILPPKLQFGPIYGEGCLGPDAADLRGLMNLMMDMISQPHLVHRLMKHIMKGRIRLLDMYDSFRKELLVNSEYYPMIMSEPFGPAEELPTLKNFWCAGNSQEFDQVSPEMFEEFCLQYQLPIFKRFGRICYGCCENLSKKIKPVLAIPNLRIFVVSAWTGLDVPLEYINRDFCLMWRQKASDVVFHDNLYALKKELNDGARKLKGQYYQCVLREVQTLAGHPMRLHEWARLALEATETYC